jgi:acyl transferase domain-containing protein
MNRLFLKGETHAVHGVACNMPLTRGQQQTFSAYTLGLDTVCEVPITRWNHDLYYDPDPESWKAGKSWTRHMSWVEGLEYFDNKMFMISPAESQGMDPTQRQILEIGYECFIDAGLVKKNIMESDTGFFLGSSAPEYQWALEEPQCGDLATMANRISFCLGMKGPNLTVDADHASPLIGITIGTHELDKGCSQVMVQGAWFNFIPMFWPAHMQGHILSAKGRCFSFDADCDGSIRADGIGSVYMRKLFNVDGVENASNLAVRAIVVGSKFANQGMAAGFTSPHGPGICSVVSEVLRYSKVSALDVDAIECHATGRLMDDAVEVASLMKVVRPFREDGNEPLPLQAVKTNQGNSWYTTAMQAFLRAVEAGRQSYMPPLLHLRQMNAFCDEEAFSRPSLFPTEILEHRAKKLHQWHYGMQLGRYKWVCSGLD